MRTDTKEQLQFKSYCLLGYVPFLHGGEMFLRNVGKFIADQVDCRSQQQHSSKSRPSETQISLKALN